MKKDLILSRKNNMIEYLTDAVKMEANIYNLEKMSEKLEEEAVALMENKPCIEHRESYLSTWGEIERKYYSSDSCGLEFDSKKINERVARLKNDFNEVNNKLQEYEKGIEERKNIDWDAKYRMYYKESPSISKRGIFYAIVACVVLTLFLGPASEEPIIGSLIMGLYIIALPLYILLAYVLPNKSAKEKSAYSKLREERERKVGYINHAKNQISHCNYIKTEIQKDLNDIYTKIEKAKQDYEFQCQEAEKMLDEKDKIDKKIQEMQEMKSNFYSCGVVPVDYRTLDCVGVLYQIFNNDLADTMREAVLLYEERAFRGDVIKGLGSIENQIRKGFDRMGMLMNNICTEVRSIYNSVNELIPTANKILSAYEQNNKIGTSILEEAQLGRKTTALLNENIEIMKKYYEEDRKKAEEYFDF